MHFAEIKINRYFAFRMMMPRAAVGRDDVAFVVEWNSDGKTVVYDVWCELENTNIRGFLISGKLQDKQCESLDAYVQRIVAHMNQRQDTLLSELGDWVKWVAHNCCGDPEDEEEE